MLNIDVKNPGIAACREMVRSENPVKSVCTEII